MQRFSRYHAFVVQIRQAQQMSFVGFVIVEFRQRRVGDSDCLVFDWYVLVSDVAVLLILRIDVLRSRLGPASGFILIGPGLVFRRK